MIRAVLDANVFVSGILNAQGAPGQVLDAWRAEQFQLLISPPILEELERVLNYPKIATRHGWSQAMVQQFLFRLTTIATTTPGDLVLSVVDDPSDNRYLECAVEGNATHLVSGDRDLLGLRRPNRHFASDQLLGSECHRCLFEARRPWLFNG